MAIGIVLYFGYGYSHSRLRTRGTPAVRAARGGSGGDERRTRSFCSASGRARYASASSWNAARSASPPPARTASSPRRSPARAPRRPAGPWCALPGHASARAACATRPAPPAASAASLWNSLAAAERAPRPPPRRRSSTAPPRQPLRRPPARFAPHSPAAAVRISAPRGAAASASSSLSRRASVETAGLAPAALRSAGTAASVRRRRRRRRRRGLSQAQGAGRLGLRRLRPGRRVPRLCSGGSRQRGCPQGLRPLDRWHRGLRLRRPGRPGHRLDRSSRHPLGGPLGRSLP